MSVCTNLRWCHCYHREARETSDDPQPVLLRCPNITLLHYCTIVLLHFYAIVAPARCQFRTLFACSFSEEGREALRVKKVRID
jgi:hypothetical protein